MINDHNKKMIFDTIIFNNRLETYIRYILLAQQNGYQIISLERFYKLKNRRKEKHLILRHDVDSKSKATRKLFEIEKELGITSTYYFRFSTIDKELIHEMIKNGFDVGLHFETISDYIKKTNCKDVQQLDIEELRDKLKDEIMEFETIIGYKTYSCCSHGAAENKQYNIANNYLTENYDVKRFGVTFEAYDKTMYENDIDCHIMDNDILYNYGFSYNDNPCNSIGKFQNIVFLAHPSHWYYDTLLLRIKKFRRWILGSAIYVSSRTFERV